MDETTPWATQPLPDKVVYDLERMVWDVRYRQYAVYMTVDLKLLLPRYYNCFLGGVNGDDPQEEYRLLPHWISQEQALLKRRHRLPPVRRLLAYSNFSREISAPEGIGYMLPGYGPLLLNLLQTWRAYPMPNATAQHLDQSIQELRGALRKARTSGWKRWW